MKKPLLCLLVASLLIPAIGDAQRQGSREKQQRSRNSLPAKKATRSTPTNSFRQQLQKALRLAQAGQTDAAANALFTLSRRPELASERPQIKYVLGTMLMELKLYQTAAFQFVDVIRMKNARYSKLAIERLSIVADALGDDTIMNYAISRVNLSDFPPKLREMIYFRLGEITLRHRDYAKAADLFSKVGSGSSYFYQAQYSKGLSEMEANQATLAISTFQTMLDGRSQAPVTDTNKVSAQMGMARALYQKKDWEAAIEAYSQVPRDTRQWHDAVFEQSWAMLRAARFRSALSNFQSMHSAYYEDFYMPESLLLRAIVYLYICKYDEMEKVLSLFEKTYGPVRANITNFMKSTSDAGLYFAELDKANTMKKSDKVANLRLPFIVLRNVLEQGNIRRSMTYLEKLKREKERIDANPSFRSSALGQYALKIINNRSKNTRYAIGDMAKAHLLNMRLELRDLYEQAGFIRYEMINGRKEGIKKKIAGKDLGEQQIDDNVDRQFYIQNGYEYYPFQGEYWLDEIGNYHYLGKQSCE